MKSIRTALAVIAFVAAGVAQAQEATPMPEQHATSTLDRASVLAETRHALWTGQHVWGNEGPEPFGKVMTQRDRATVLAEATAASKLSSAEMQKSRLINGM